MARIAPPPVHRIAWFQLLILALISVALLPIEQSLAASAAVGGLIQIIPQAWFTRQAYRYSGARQIRNVVNAMYRGETGKILLTAALFAVVFRMAGWINPVVFFLAYGAMILVQLLSASKLLNGAR
ncbi:ATP synthase subunit I [Porticoccaceae bacterium LTM1]|nr:ATP synthase subunit I [Porticoccaceae bacterium LTM1]